MTKKTLCDRCLAIGAISGYKNVCEATCKGGRMNKERIQDAEQGEN